MREPYVFAISGYKNAGKTTMVTSLLPYLNRKGYRVATIKHDGHDFEADVPGTDSYEHAKAGAYGTAVFSATKYMLVKKQEQVSEQELIRLFPEADMILLEGFKFSTYPKLEVVRKEITDHPACIGFHLEAIATDVKLGREVPAGISVFALDAYKEIADFIEGRYKEWIKSKTIE